MMKLLKNTSKIEMFYKNIQWPDVKKGALLVYGLEVI